MNRRGVSPLTGNIHGLAVGFQACISESVSESAPEDFLRESRDDDCHCQILFVINMGILRYERHGLQSF